MIYAFVFETDRAYGGPEEGGWYFDCGEPIDHPLNRVFATIEEARAYQQEVAPILDAQNREEGRRDPNSVLSRGNYLNLEVWHTVPAPYPATRPTYS